MEETLTIDQLPQRKPPWLRVKLPTGPEFRKVRGLVDQYRLHTICESGNCPNMGECWGAGTATFMILGNVCTRACSFCAVATGRPGVLDLEEPYRVAEAVRRMEVKHAVLTSVNRDELPDRGAGVWAATVCEIRRVSPGTTMETLIPDVKAHWEALETIMESKPEVVSHNMETIARLYRTVRPQARYERSLEQLARIKKAGLRTKTGFMVGLGETPEEVRGILADLQQCGVDVVTIGQYLQPTKNHLPVQEYIRPEQFELYASWGLEMGLEWVEAGPLVRSSYHAERHLHPRNAGATLS